eukprot:1142022-Amphidinium_carterae.2
MPPVLQQPTPWAQPLFVMRGSLRNKLDPGCQTDISADQSRSTECPYEPSCVSDTTKAAMLHSAEAIATPIPFTPWSWNRETCHTCFGSPLLTAEALSMHCKSHRKVPQAPSWSLSLLRKAS